MKKIIIFLCTVLVLLGAGLLFVLRTAERAVQMALAEQFPAAATVQTEPETTAAPETLPPTTVPPETEAPYVLFFSEEEEELLLKIGMAERGDTGCTECIALVMRTVLNRVEGPKFSSTIRGVLYAQDQFTPVMDGTLESAVPNEDCREALDLVKRGWDESQGALYYEWCQGESWHSKNLNLLFQHCDTRFYN